MDLNATVVVQAKKYGGLKWVIEMKKVVNGRVGTATVDMTSKLCSFPLFHTAFSAQ